MNKKTLVLAVVAALGVGGVGTFAYQSHAQKTNDAPLAPVVANQVVTPTPLAPAVENTKTDTDNIQDDNGAVDKPYTAVTNAPVDDNNTQVDKETNNDKATTSVKFGESKEQNEGTAKDANEKEDAD